MAVVATAVVAAVAVVAVVAAVAQDAEATPVPGIDNPMGTQLINLIGPYVFEFTLPYIAEVVLEPMLSVESNGITMRLESLSVSPSMTLGRLCMQLSTQPGDWLPDLTITMNEIPQREQLEHGRGTISRRHRALLRFHRACCLPVASDDADAGSTASAQRRDLNAGAH
ncbi:MAG: hypothetical protein U0694_02970 [Anaerolineae bacterium]